LRRPDTEGRKPARPLNRPMTTILVTVGVVFHTLGVLSSAHAVMTTRTPQGAVAWAVSLLTFPYLAVPAYWILGRSRFGGYVDARQDSKSDLGRYATLALDPLGAYAVPEEIMLAVPAGRAAERLSGMPYLTHNEAELLVDGEVTFASILKGLERAREYILFQFFIVKDDRIGREVKERLIARARDGLRVFFLYDEVGSSSLGRAYLADLRHAGVHALPFNTRKGPSNRFQLNFRNHRKVVVIDGEEAWVGGHNVGDEYLSRDAKIGPWRDTHMRLRGPAALAVQWSFVEDWYWAADEILELNWDPVVCEADLPILVLPTGPADELETAALMFIHAINSAERRIWIASPYFVPDGAVVAALQLAGLRGVDVRIIIPDEPDHLGVYLAAFTYVEQAARTGVRFFRYTAGFMHQKVMLVDDRVATVGTANFDNRSFRLNFEITSLVVDEVFAEEVEAMLEADLARCEPMLPDALARRPLWFRVAAAVARLTAPVQ